MYSSYRKSSALLTWTALALIGCSGPSSTGIQYKATASSAADHTSQASGSTADAIAAGPEAPLPSGKGLISAKYNIVARALGINLCKGTMQLNVNGAMTTQNTSQLLEVPQGSVKCSILGSIDLSSILGAISKVPGTADPISVTDNVIGLNTLGSATYTPARPFLPSFLASSGSALSTLNVTRSVQVTADGISDSGTSSIVMQSFNKPYTSTLVGQTFPNTMDFIVTNTGYNKIDKVANFIFDTMEYKISTSPVAIVQIIFVGKAKAVASAAGDDPGAATGIIGKIGTHISKHPNGFISDVAGHITLKMTLDLIEQDGLAAQTVAGDPTDNLGEQIGGQPASGT